MFFSVSYKTNNVWKNNTKTCWSVIDLENLADTNLLSLAKMSALLETGYSIVIQSIWTNKIEQLGAKRAVLVKYMTAWLGISLDI